MTKKRAVKNVKKADKAPEPYYKEAITEYRMRVLLWMLRDGPVNTNQLVVQFCNTIDLVSKEAIAESLRILEKRGLVQRTKSKDDGRVHPWQLVN